MKKIVALIAILIAISSCVKQNQKPDETLQADLYYNKGLEYNLKEQHSTALKYYDSAIMIRDDASYFTNRGSTKYILKDYNGAIGDLEKSLELDSTDFTALFILGALHNDLAKYKEALSYFQRSLKLNDKQSEIYARIGFLNYQLKKYSDAVNAFTQHLNSSHPFWEESTLLYMGYCYEKLGDINAAKEHWEQAAKMGEQEAQHKLDSLKRR